MALELEKINDQFDAKKFERYSREMNTLCEIIDTLKFLLKRSERLIYSGKDESLKHREYFNEKTDKFVESMLKYAVKQQKELVDDMYDKLDVDQISEIDELDIYENYVQPEINELNDHK